MFWRFNHEYEWFTKLQLILIKSIIFQVFIHVSTAYAFPHEEIVYEKEYKHIEDPHKVIEMIDGQIEDKVIISRNEYE